MKVAINPRSVNRVGIIGAGNIGAGWAAHFLARGMDVVASDPAAGAEQRLRRLVDKAWPVLEQRGLTTGASRDRIKFTSTIDETFADVEFVQESAPEDVATKQAIVRDVSKIVRPDIVIASSASYITVSDIQRLASSPERVVLGHPCHPSYLVPLVEVCAGQQTAPAAIDWALAFYRHNGHEPLLVKKEILGYVINRIQRALFAECMRLYAEGVATTQQIDAALHLGPALRLSLMGPFLSRCIASGDTGPRKMYEWQRANKITFPFEADYPDLTDALIQTLADEATEQIDGRSMDELEAMRDQYILALLKLKRATDWPQKTIDG